MPVTQNGTEYFVKNQDGRTNRKEHWVDGANQATEYLQCRWQDDYRNLVSDLLGRGAWVGGNLNRALPMRHPLYDWMICTEAELVEVIGTPTDDGDIGQFKDDAKAVVAATFKSVLYEVLTDIEAGNSGFGELSRYVQRQSKYGLDLLEMKGAPLTFSDTNAVIAQFATRPYPNMPLVYTWYRVPSVIPGAGGRPDGFPAKLFENIAATVGKINLSSFDGFYDAGTLLCGQPDIEQRVGPLGDIEFTIKYNFTWHSPKDNKAPVGGVQTDSWNVKYRRTSAAGAVDPGMYPVGIQNSGGDTPFRRADFEFLFRNS